MNSLYKKSRKRILFLFAISIMLIGGVANIIAQYVNDYYSEQLIENENARFVELFMHTAEFESETNALSYAEHYAHLNDIGIMISSDDEVIFESERLPQNLKTYSASLNGKTYDITIDNSNNYILVINEREALYINYITIGAIGILMIYVVVSRRIRNKKILYDVSSINQLINTDEEPRQDLNFIELQEIYNAFNNKITTIDLMEEKRKDNLNGLVHDLKTPITILLNHLEDISSPEDLILNKDAVAQSLQDLSVTASDLISENFMGTKNRFQLSQHLNKELLNYIHVFKSKNITLKYNILPDAVVDWNKRDFGRVLRNLLTNAYYYSNPDTIVYVNLTNMKTKYQLQVINQGNTIKKKDLDRIFEKSIRTNEDDNVEGNGLGLYITRLLVEEIGAKIYADSNETENIFTIEFMKYDS